MPRNYSLTGPEALNAIQRGLAEADWRLSPVPRETMRELLVRRNWPAIRDCTIWLGLLAGSGWMGWLWWGTWWAVLPFAIYGVLYATVSDSRWHEASHGTPFRTDWLNTALYELASFMVQRESVPWRWSHTRHHSDTMVVGRDPEVQVPRPTRFRDVLGKFFALKAQPRYYRRLLRHALGRMDADERTYVPESEFPGVYRRARICLAIYGAVVVAAVVSGSLLPLMYIGLPTVYGTWMMPFFTLTQHAGLREDVLDHRLNSRTVLMNPLCRFLYWNMNYHIEHHMYPLVPYHALPRLHAAVKDDLPPATPGILAALREILPALWRQRKEPDWYIPRTLPTPCQQEQASLPAEPAVAAVVDAAGWVTVVEASALARGQALRVDHGRRTFAIYRTAMGMLYATDGMCTHGNRHLGDGLVIGEHIECPKHNGRFHLADGAPSRPPACRALRTYPIEERDGRIHIQPGQPGGAGTRATTDLRLRVVSNRPLTAFITELVLEPLAGAVAFTPGDYLQFAIPAFGRRRFADLPIASSQAQAWEPWRHLEVEHSGEGRRNNYSIASVPADGTRLRFNVRIALPKPGSGHPPGVGSAWIFGLQPGDTVEAIGPHGDFHIQPTLREMVYIGGGAGMAPIRAHLGALLGGTTPSPRKISFWYGARTRRDLFYHEEFTALAARHAQFHFTVALSEAAPDDAWDGETGFIHEVVKRRHLAGHPDPTAIEYYLCGPPPMVATCTAMLREMGVDERRIICDAF
jgi:Na+-transporting NADH:ubiquinone oxidoreductase subunit F